MASKKKLRRRMLGASCILAAMIVAGASFAWFTSQDEVVNKLSANNKYNVAIVEDFTPPTNWTPGHVVKKEVGTTNTGNVDAFVKTTLSSDFVVTTYSTVSSTAVPGTEGNTNNYVTLSQTKNEGSLPDTQATSADEVKEQQAGGRLIVKAGTKVEKEQDQIKDGTGFTPTDTGVYIFEKNVQDDTKKGETKVLYSGYYFVPTTGAGAGAGVGTYYAIVTEADANGYAGFKFKTTEEDKTVTNTDVTYALTGNVLKVTYQGKDGDSADDDIVINITLDNTGTTAGDVWTVKDNGTSAPEFYYNKLLKAGATSSDFIKSVELDKTVTNDAFVKMDYNLHVYSDSVQVVEDRTTEATTAVNAASWGKTATYTSDDSVTWANP